MDNLATHEVAQGVAILTSAGATDVPGAGADAVWTYDFQCTVPDIPPGYYPLIKIDHSNDVLESNESNNVHVGDIQERVN